MEKKGLSAVVGTILIILLVIVAVGIIWAVASGLFKGGAEEMSTGFLIDLDIKSASLEGSVVSISVKRNVGAGTLSGIKFVFSDGESTKSAEKSTSMDELDQESFSFNIDTLDIPDAYEVSIAPIYKSESGEDILRNIVDRAEFREAVGNGNGGNGCVPDCTGPDEIEGTEDDLVCGDDGCGGSCGNCEDPLLPTCGGDGLCYADDCIPDPDPCATQGAQCGEVNDGCGTMVQCTDQCSPTQECVDNICQDLIAEESGLIDNVWPPGSGIYFDDDLLPPEDGKYYGYAAFFPTVDTTQCFLIVGYSYDAAVYANAIVELNLLQPLAIATDSDYEIWESISDCQTAHGL